LHELRQKARKEYKLNGKKVPYVLMKGSLDIIMNHLTPSDKRALQKDMNRAIAEVESNSTHKVYSDDKDKVGEEMMDQAAERAFVAERQFLNNGSVAESGSFMNPIVKSVMAGLKTSKAAIAPGQLDDTDQDDNNTSAADGQASSDTNDANDAKQNRTSSVCIPKIPPLNEIKRLIHRITRVAHDVLELTGEDIGLDDQQLKDAQEVRAAAIAFLKKSCRIVPPSLVVRPAYAAAGLEDVHKVMQSFYASAVADAQSRGNMQRRLELEMNREAAACSNAKSKLSDADAVEECVKHVMQRLTVLIKGDQSPMVHEMDLE